ncbi:hypothetical protein V6Z12_D04G013100 [Gossypium hirsutum]
MQMVGLSVPSKPPVVLLEILGSGCDADFANGPELII